VTPAAAAGRRVLQPNGASGLVLVAFFAWLVDEEEIATSPMA
jgi:hypothetical protein